MREFILSSILIFLCFSCTMVQEQPERLIADSNYSRYEQKKATVESSYLNNEINYSEYKAKLTELEQERLKSEHEREEILFK